MYTEVQNEVRAKDFEYVVRQEQHELGRMEYYCIFIEVWNIREEVNYMPKSRKITAIDFEYIVV